MWWPTKRWQPPPKGSGNLFKVKIKWRSTQVQSPHDSQLNPASVGPEEKLISNISIKAVIWCLDSKTLPFRPKSHRSLTTKKKPVHAHGYFGGSCWWENLSSLYKWLAICLLSENLKTWHLATAASHWLSCHWMWLIDTLLTNILP